MVGERYGDGIEMGSRLDVRGRRPAAEVVYWDFHRRMPDESRQFRESHVSSITEVGSCAREIVT